MSEDTELVGQAHRGTRGLQQSVIARTGIAITAMLLRKNSDYGASAFSSPAMAPHMTPRDALLCRMSDKVARVASLSKKAAEVPESLDDTIRDLAGYCMLWLCLDVEPSPELAGARSTPPTLRAGGEGDNKGAGEETW